MNLGAEPFLKAVLAASWQGSLVILLILLVRPLLGLRIPARWRSMLWMLALVRLLVPAFILPPSPASLQNLRLVTFDRTEIFFDESYSLPTSPPELSPADHGAKPPAPPSPPSAYHLTFGQAVPWWKIGCGVWLSGAAMMAAWILGATWRLHRRLRWECGEPSGSAASAWNACCERLGFTRRPRLLAARFVDSPALIGVFHPAVIIPLSGLEAFTAQDWENVFMHELGHYRRLDHWTNAIQLAALALHWFNPFVWFAFRALGADRELAADEWALGHLPNAPASTYGGTLLKILRTRSGYGAPAGMLCILEDYGQIKQRLRHVAAYVPRRPAGSFAGLAMTLALACAVLGREVENNVLPAKTAAAADPSVDPAPAQPENTVPIKPAVTGIPVSRGRILDRNQQILAANLTSLVLGVRFPSPLTFSDSEAIAFARKQMTLAAELISRTAPMSDSTILSAYKLHGAKPLDFARELTPLEQETITKQGGDGLVVHPVEQRDYPNGVLAAHVVGSMASRGGISGMDAAYDWRAHLS